MKYSPSYSYCAVLRVGTNFARALAALPPNILNPETYTNTVIKEMARTYEWELREWTSAELEELGL